MNEKAWILVIAILLAACTDSPAPQATESSAAAEPEKSVSLGEAKYLKHCSECHDKTVYKSPSRMFISMTGARNVMFAMTSGAMVEQAAMLSNEERAAIAEFLTGQDPTNLPEEKAPPRCDADHGFDAGSPPVSLGWGVQYHF